MQERRTTVRIHRFCRAQYCPAEELLPRDGRLTTVSERGAGLLVREPHRSGEQVTVGFPLPGDHDSLTATGVVRWTAPTPLKGSWYPLGLEWLPLEETTRHRLHEFLSHQARAVPTSKTARFSPVPQAALAGAPRFLLMGGAAVMALLLAWLGAAWVVSLVRKDRELAVAVERRNVTILSLKQREAKVRQELAETQQHVVASAAEVARLDQLTQQLGGETQRVSQDVERFQASYVNVREEREELLSRVQDLAQERTLRARRSVSLTELHQAIRDAIEAREAATRVAAHGIPLLASGIAFPALPPSSPDRSLDGNRGYLLWQGRSTSDDRPTVSIRVHEPEPVQ